MSDPRLSVDPREHGRANLIYILYLCSFIVGITSVIGVIMAYLARDGADPLLRSHYDNLINIFWKMLLFTIIGALLTIVLIGILIILAAIVWFVIRILKGMQALSADQPIDNPGSWGI